MFKKIPQLMATSKINIKAVAFVIFDFNEDIMPI